VGACLGSVELVSPNTAEGAGALDDTVAELRMGRGVEDCLGALVTRVLSESPKTAVGAGNAVTFKAEDEVDAGPKAEEEEEGKSLLGNCRAPFPATNTYGCEDTGGGGISAASPRYRADFLSLDMSLLSPGPVSFESVTTSPLSTACFNVAFGSLRLGSGLIARVLVSLVCWQASEALSRASAFDGTVLIDNEVSAIYAGGGVICLTGCAVSTVGSLLFSSFAFALSLTA